MTTPRELWPPFGLVVRSGDLTLTPVTDDDLPGLVDLVRSGVHGADARPFGIAWTDRPAEQVAPEFARYHWRVRAAFTPEDVHLDRAVRHRGELVGTQGFFAADYPVTRSAETGSWLALQHQGRGIGTRMRQAVCTLLLDHLGAAEITSGAFLDPASLAVSRKVGYRHTDTKRAARQGELALHALLRPGRVSPCPAGAGAASAPDPASRRSESAAGCAERVRRSRSGCGAVAAPAGMGRHVLSPEDLVRGEPVEVSGAEPLRAFLGVG